MARRFENATKILELWLDCIENMQDVNDDSIFLQEDLKHLLLESQRYKKYPERYEKALERLKASLRSGHERVGVFIQQNIKWGLSDETLSVINREKFKEEKIKNYYIAVENLINQVKKETWMEYYNATYLIRIEIPIRFRPYIHGLRETESPGRWFDPSGIGTQEYKEGLYPKKSIHLLKMQIESAWKKNRGVAIIADPAYGKTTSISILRTKWQEENDNRNICLTIPSAEWSSDYQDLKKLFHKYHDTNPKYQFIVIIENIHRVSGEIEDFDEILSTYGNVRFLMTSRNKIADQHIEVIGIPNGYNGELALSILKYYNTEIGENKTKVKSLITGKYRNIIELFSEISQYFKIPDLDISQEELIDKWIVASKKKTGISEWDYWHWVLLLLTTFRKYEIEMTKLDFYNGCRLYDPTIDQGKLGKTSSYLIDDGYISQTSGHSPKVYVWTYHPTTAEKAVEILRRNLDYLEEDITELQILSKYLEGKTIKQLRAVKGKIGNDFDMLDLDFAGTIDSLKNEKTENDFTHRFQVFHLLNSHPNFSNLINEIFSAHDIEKLLLNLNMDQSAHLDQIELIFTLIDHFDPELTLINCQRFLDKLELWKYEDFGDGIDEDYGIGHNIISILFDRRDGFVKECQSYISSLQARGRIERFFDFSLRIQRRILLDLDFKKITPLFLVSFFVERYESYTPEYSYFYEDYDSVENFEELSKVWNGPSFKQTVTLLFTSISLSIQNFNSKLTIYDSQSEENSIVETKYDLDISFVKKMRRRFEIGEVIDHYMFEAPASTHQHGIERFEDHKFIKRLVLIHQYFKDYYDLIRQSDVCRALIRAKIRSSLESDKALYICPVPDVIFTQIFFDFDFILSFESLSDIRVLNKWERCLLFVTDFSKLEEVILSNPFYGWSRLSHTIEWRLSHTIEPLKGDLPEQYTSYGNKKRDLGQIIDRINSTLTLAHETITSRNLIEDLRKRDWISSQSLVSSLKLLYKQTEKDDLDFEFFISLEKTINDHFDRRCANDLEYREQCIKRMWLTSLKFDYTRDTKKQIYKHCLKSSDTFKESVFISLNISKDIDVLLFTSQLLRVKNDVKGVFNYLWDSPRIFEELLFSKDDARKLIQNLFECDLRRLTNGFQQRFRLIIKGMLNTEVIERSDLRKYFTIRHFLEIYSSIQKNNEKWAFLDFLITSSINELAIPDLTNRIGINSILNGISKKWNLNLKDESKGSPLILIGSQKEDIFLDSLFSDSFGRVVIRKLFEQISFEGYKKSDRYKILFSLDELLEGYKNMSNLIFHLHSELIEQKKDPFFIIDPTDVLDPSQSYGYRVGSEKKRLFKFLSEESLIRSNLKKDFELIISEVYHKGNEWKSADVEFLLRLIVQVWGSLIEFSEDLKLWEDISKEILYEILSGRPKYFEDIRQVFEPAFRINQEKKLLLEVTITEDISRLFSFLQKYKIYDVELKKILRSTKGEQWMWNLTELKRNYVYEDAIASVPYSPGSRKMADFDYLLKILEFEQFFHFDVNSVIREIIEDISPTLLYDILEVPNKIREQFWRELVEQLSLLSLYHLIELIVNPKLTEFVAVISATLTEKLIKSKLSQSIFLLCLSYSFFCNSLLKDSVKQEEVLLGVKELNRVLLKWLKNTKKDEIAEILIALRNPKITVVSAYYLSQPDHLNHLALDKEEIENLIDFVLSRYKSQENILSSTPYLLFPEEEQEDAVYGLYELRHFVPPDELWCFIDSHLRINWAKKLEDNKSDIHLLKLLSHDGIEFGFKKDDLLLATQYIFASKTLKNLRREMARIYLHQADTIVSHLSKLLIKSHEFYSLEEFYALIKVVYKDYLQLLALDYNSGTSWSTLKALKILDERLGVWIQEEWIKIYNTYLQTDHLRRDYSDVSAPLSYFPRKDRNSDSQIAKLKFLKENLTVFYEYILENTRFKDFEDVIGRSWEDENYNEEFWFLCHEEKWIEEAKKFVLAEFDILTYSKENEEKYTIAPFKLALLCKYMVNKREVLQQYVKSVLNPEKYSSQKNRTKSGKVAVNTLEEARLLNEVDKEKLRELAKELQKLKEVPLRKAQLIFEHRDQIKDLEERIKQEEKSIERPIKANPVNKRTFKGVYDEEAYNYLKDWMKE